MFRFLPIIISTTLSLTPLPPFSLSQETGTEEATADTASQTDAVGQWWDSGNGSMYYIDNDPVSGWNRIDGSWYYFGADKIKKTDTEVGIYRLDNEGKLINATDDAPFPHGEVYNSSASGSVVRNSSDYIETETAISELYDKHENGEITSKDEIMKVRYRYNALNMSEKARVHNEYKLADLENIYGVTYDYSKIYDPADSYNTDSSYTKGNDFTFSLDEYASALTVIVRFPEGDDTEVSIVAPSGSTTVFEKDTSQIRNQSMNLYLTWTDSYLQIDIAHGDYGTWNIKTDDICSFTTKEYAGNRSEIHAIPEDVVASRTDSIKQDEEAEDSENTGVRSTIALISFFFLIIGYVVFRIILARHMSGKGKKAGKKKECVSPEKKVQPEKEPENGYDEYLAMKAMLQEEYAEFEEVPEDKEVLDENKVEEATDPLDEENFDAVEVTASVQQFDESYLEDDGKKDWMEEYYFG